MADNQNQAQSNTQSATGRWLVGLGVFAVGAAVALFVPILDRYSAPQNMTETVDMRHTVPGQIVQLFSSQTSYPAGDFTADMIVAGIIPSNMVTMSPPGMRHSEGGRVILHGTSGGTGFRIEFHDMSASFCSETLIKWLPWLNGSNALIGVTVTRDAPASKADEPEITEASQAQRPDQLCSSKTRNGLSIYYR